MLTETDELIADLPIIPEGWADTMTVVQATAPNATVFFDPRKRVIEIYPTSGGVIMMPVWQATGDIAPFCD